MGAKKKLKTQLELEKEKSEGRCLNSWAPTLVTSSGVAECPPPATWGPCRLGVVAMLQVWRAWPWAVVGVQVARRAHARCSPAIYNLMVMLVFLCFDLHDVAQEGRQESWREADCGPYPKFGQKN